LATIKLLYVFERSIRVFLDKRIKYLKLVSSLLWLNNCDCYYYLQSCTLSLTWLVCKINL